MRSQDDNEEPGDNEEPDEPEDITLPGDEVVPTSDNSPGGEQALNAIDDNPSTKYLNFDQGRYGFDHHDGWRSGDWLGADISQ